MIHALIHYARGEVCPYGVQQVYTVILHSNKVNTQWVSHLVSLCEILIVLLHLQMYEYVILIIVVLGNIRNWHKKEGIVMNILNFVCWAFSLQLSIIKRLSVVKILRTRKELFGSNYLHCIKGEGVVYTLFLTVTSITLIFHYGFKHCHHLTGLWCLDC